MLLSPVLIDLIFAATSYVFCIFLLYKSYEGAGPSWKRLYAIELRVLEQNYVISGIFAGSILCTLLFGSYLISSLVSRDAYEFTGAYLLFFLPLLYFVITIFCIVHAEAKIRVNSMDQVDNDLLRHAYFFYRFYAAAFWLFALLGLVKIYFQFHFDAGQQQLHIDEFMVLVSKQELWSFNEFTDMSLIDIEFSKNLYNEISRSLIKQLEPITSYSIYWLSIGLMIKLTPLGKVIEGTAKMIGYYLTPLFIGVVVLASVWIYFIQFSALSSEAIRLYDFSLDMEQTSSDHIRRIVELKNETLRYTGISGFFRVFADEGGLYIIGLAAAQALIGVFTGQRTRAT